MATVSSLTKRPSTSSSLRAALRGVQTAPAKALAAGVKNLQRLPQVALMRARAAAHDLGQHWNQVVRESNRPLRGGPLPHAQLEPRSRVEVPLGRPMTAREKQVVADRVFFANHRGELATGWAARGRDGQLHVMRHASPAAEMFRAIDNSTRVEGSRDSVEYARGEAEGGAQSVRSTLRGASNLLKGLQSLVTTNPSTSVANTAAALHRSGAGDAAVEFSRNSTRILDAEFARGLHSISEAHNDPRTAGQLMGHAGAGVALTGLTSWTSAGMWALGTNGVKLVSRGTNLLRATTAAEDVAVSAAAVPTKWPLTHFTTQHPDRIRTSVESALRSSDRALRLEGEVAQAAGDKLVGFRKPIGVNRSVGEIDVETTRAVIEVTIAPGGKMQQLKRLVPGTNLTRIDLNPTGKEVILYAPRYPNCALNDVVQAGAHPVRTIDQLKELLEALEK